MTTYALSALANIDTFIILIVVLTTALIDPRIGYFAAVIGPISTLFFIRRYLDAFEGAVVFILQFLVMLFFFWLTMNIAGMAFTFWIFWLIWRMGARWD